MSSVHIFFDRQQTFREDSADPGTEGILGKTEWLGGTGGGRWRHRHLLAIGSNWLVNLVRLVFSVSPSIFLLSGSGVALIQALSSLTGLQVQAPMGLATGSFQNSESATDGTS